jgi:hypothetical protein
VVQALDLSGQMQEKTADEPFFNLFRAVSALYVAGGAG